MEDVKSGSQEYGLRVWGKDCDAFLILDIGAGKVGAKILLQIKKNPKLEVKTVDYRRARKRLKSPKLNRYQQHCARKNIPQSNRGALAHIHLCAQISVSFT